MATTETRWTVNSIQAAMRARGSHWWDPATMRTFGTKPLPTVYSGPGGVYFVTADYDDDNGHKYTVRQFDPVECEISTVGALASMTKDAAIRAAKEAAIRQPGCGLLVSPEAGGVPYAARGLQTATEEFEPVTVLDQFLADLRQHGNPNADWGEAKMLINRAFLHHTLMEWECNYGNQFDSDGNPLSVLAACRDKITYFAQRAGAVRVLFSGDPRGATVKLVFADGATNDFGGEGWIVPTDVV